MACGWCRHWQDNGEYLGRESTEEADLKWIDQTGLCKLAPQAVTTARSYQCAQFQFDRTAYRGWPPAERSMIADWWLRASRNRRTEAALKAEIKRLKERARKLRAIYTSEPGK